MIYKVFLLYVRSYLNVLFKSGNDSLYFLAGKSLLKDELRAGVNEKNNIWFGFKTWKRTVLRINKEKTLNNVDVNKTVLIFDGGNHSFIRRIEFVNYFTKRNYEYKTFSLQDSIYNIGLFDKVFQIAIISFLNLFTVPLSVFVKDKSKIILQPVYLLETLGFARYCLKNKILKVYYFCIYENNSNINAILLKKLGIVCCKIPSEVPLIFHNKIIIADELAICFEYQKDEIKRFSETILVETYLNWGPENIKKVAELFPNGQTLTENSKCTVGFFSSGNAMRKVQGKPEANTDFNPALLEETILKQLNSIIENSDYKLLICLHPLEKKEENIIQSKEYYTSVLTCNYSIASIEKPTFELHNNINIAVGLYSTILFERIYLGFKTLIIPIGLENYFPIENSLINGICVTDIDFLKDKLKSNIELAPYDYFQKNNVLKYSPRFFLNEL